MTKKESILQFIKFALISCSAGIIELGSFAIFNELLHWPYWLSYLIALVLSVLWNFTLNRRYTFKSAANIPVAMAKVFGYYCVFTPLSTLLEHYLTETLGWNEYIVTFLNMVINMVTEYLFCRFVVYRNNMNTRVVKEDSK